MLDSMEVDFNQIETECAGAGLSDGRAGDGEYLIRDCVAVICLLREKSSGEKIIVVSGHLFWDPRANDVKLLQAWWLLKKLEEFSTKSTGARILLAGDFNSVPGSTVVNLICRGCFNPGEDSETVSPRLQEWLRLDENQFAVGFSSVYQSKYVSNFTEGFSGMIDYIMAQSGSTFASPLETFDVPCVDELKSGGLCGIPSHMWPSDHFAIGAKLCFCEKASKN